MCARTTCPFVNVTRNIAFGSASDTEPSISIAPSFLAKQYLLLYFKSLTGFRPFIPELELADRGLV